MDKKTITELHDVNKLSFRKIGKKFGVSGQRIQQIYSNRQQLNLLKVKKVEDLLIKLKIKSSVKEGGRDFVRDIIRIRDKQTCLMCGKKWKEGERRLDVHHKDEGLFGKNRDRGIIEYDKHHADRLVTLCHGCHIKIHYLLY